VSAVWAAARAAIRRRRLQTTVIGIVVLLSTVTLTVGLGLLDAASHPFDRIFDRQHGAHTVVSFDAGHVSTTQLAATASSSGVTDAAGPFGQTSIGLAPGSVAFLPGPLSVVGRPDPAGSVDQVNLWAGRWSAGLGEIVVNEVPPPPGRHSPFPLGGKVVTQNGTELTIVGYAYSVSRTADAWVSPAQMEQMHPTSLQMLYRLKSAGTQGDVDSSVRRITAGLPKSAVIATQSYLTVKQDVAAGPGVWVPFLMAFGVLGVIVSILIVANVISGAVIAGFRHIGVLKSLGFTPGQVVAVYLLMVSVPAAAGCLIGTVGGVLAAKTLMSRAFQGTGMDLNGLSVSPWVPIVAVTGMIALVLIAAVVPSMRARKLSAAETISGASAPRPGRWLRTQQWLSGSRLPRSVSLGLALPFARPTRSAMTLVAVLLGVTTATFATGLASTVTKFAKATTDASSAQVVVEPGQPQLGQVGTKLDDRQIEQKLRSSDGTRHVTVDVHVPVSLAGAAQSVVADFWRGDTASLDFTDKIVDGRWVQAADEVALSTALLHKWGLKVGDELTVEVGGKQIRTTVVASLLSQRDELQSMLTTLSGTGLDVSRLNPRYQYFVELAPGTDVSRYAAAVKTADPGLYPTPNSDSNSFATAVISLASILTVLLCVVATLGVFNTVVLNTRERRRELGTLQSIGMTPNQVISMIVTSMAAVGVLGGLLGVPMGILAHQLLMPIVGDAARVDLPPAMIGGWQTPVLVLLFLSGIGVAAVGALFPARATTRMVVARALHSE
jgi:putative ABC transport system permease protein